MSDPLPMPSPGTYDVMALCASDHPKPYIPSDLVDCQVPGCGHKCWYDARYPELRKGARVVFCTCCANRRIPSIAW